jgi:hypothetical protein
VAAAVGGADVALDDATGIELIEQRDQTAGNHAKPFGERLLRKAGRGLDNVQNSGVMRSEFQGREPLGEFVRGVTAELGEQEGGAEGAGSGGSLVLAADRLHISIIAVKNHSVIERLYERTTSVLRRYPMSTSSSPIAASTVAAPRIRHQGPPLGVLAAIYMVLFCTGLYFVTSFGGKPYFPGPWEPVSTMQAFFSARPHAVLLCAFFQFGAAIVLGIFTATIVNQMRFLGVRAAGVNIALFGGFATAFSIFASACTLWAMAQHGVAQDAIVTEALYYFSFAFGGPGFSVPLGLLIAGISVPAMFMRLLPKWVTVAGIALGVIGELSWLNLVFPRAVFLVPLTRFPGFIWLIAAGFLLPRTVKVQRGRQPGSDLAS